MTRTNVRRTVTTGAVVTTAVAATVTVGLGTSAAQTTGKPAAPGRRFLEHPAREPGTGPRTRSSSAFAKQSSDGS